MGLVLLSKQKKFNFEANLSKPKTCFACVSLLRSERMNPLFCLLCFVSLSIFSLHIFILLQNALFASYHFTFKCLVLFHISHLEAERSENKNSVCLFRFKFSQFDAKSIFLFFISVPFKMRTHRRNVHFNKWSLVTFMITLACIHKTSVADPWHFCADPDPF